MLGTPHAWLVEYRKSFMALRCWLMVMSTFPVEIRENYSGGGSRGFVPCYFLNTKRSFYAVLLGKWGESEEKQVPMDGFDRHAMLFQRQHSVSVGTEMSVSHLVSVTELCKTKKTPPFLKRRWPPLSGMMVVKRCFLPKALVVTIANRRLHVMQASKPFISGCGHSRVNNLWFHWRTFDKLHDGIHRVPESQFLLTNMSCDL